MRVNSLVFCSASALLAVAVCHAAPEFVLAESLYAAPGVECNVYFADVFDSVRPENYAFEALSPVGRCERFRWCWTPKADDAGKTVRLTLRALSDEGDPIEATTEVRVAPAPADGNRRLTLALLGASISNSGYPARVMDLMRTNGYPNYTPVGSHAGAGRPVTPGSVAYDGYGGFKWGDFLRRWMNTTSTLPFEQQKAEGEALRLADGTIRLTPENYKLRSPLLRLEADGKTTRLDIPGWFGRINGGEPPDVIAVVLAGNDVFRGRPDTIDGLLKKTFEDATTLLDALRAAAPRAHIAVGTFPLGTDQDAFGQNYGCLQSAVQYRRNVFAYNRAVQAFVKARGDANLSVIPLHAALDPAHSFPTHLFPAHAQADEKVARTVNALHPLPCGGRQLGDAFYAWLANRVPMLTSR